MMMLTWLDRGIKGINRNKSGKKINNWVGHAILGWEWEGTQWGGGLLEPGVGRCGEQ
jgi:hypothetical protein